jgi:hypothetical protein
MTKKRKGNNFFPLKGTQLNGHPIIKQKKKRFFPLGTQFGRNPIKGLWEIIEWPSNCFSQKKKNISSRLQLGGHSIITK